MKITVVAPSFECGGTQRAIEKLTKGWIGLGHQVTVITLMDAELAPDFVRMPAGVVLRRLDVVAPQANLGRRLVSAPGLILRVRREIIATLPDVVVSFLDWVNVVTALALQGTKACVSHIASERTAAKKSHGCFVLRLLSSILYRWVDALVVVDPTSLFSLPSVTKERAVYIGNFVQPLDIARISDSKSDGSEESLIVGALGRLEYEKGFDILIDAFARIAPENSCLKLCIWGEGSMRYQLEDQVQSLGLSSRVLLPGATPDYREVLTKCDLFVLPSRYEGFPNALVEAMSCQLPVVAFDCPGANTDIIQHDSTGILVDFAQGADGLSVALTDLINNPYKRESLGRNAKKSVEERFAPHVVLSQWEAVFHRVVKRPSIASASAG